MTPDSRRLSPRQVAANYGVAHDKVLRWIKAGELKAIDVSTKVGGRPQFKIAPSDLKAFEQARAVVPPAKPTRQRKRNPSVKQFV